MEMEMTELRACSELLPSTLRFLRSRRSDSRSNGRAIRTSSLAACESHRTPLASLTSHLSRNPESSHQSHLLESSHQSHLFESSHQSHLPLANQANLPPSHPPSHESNTLPYEPSKHRFPPQGNQAIHASARAIGHKLPLRDAHQLARASPRTPPRDGREGSSAVLRRRGGAVVGLR